MKSLAGMVLALTLSATTGAHAWWDAGHMQIAWLAWQKLDAQTRLKADALLQLNPDYPKWVAGAPPGRVAEFAFTRAAVWADDIKLFGSGYTRDNATSPGASQNIGYADKNQHAYWHYRDQVWSPDGTQTIPAEPVDALTQLSIMIPALKAGSGASDDVRSYDLAWILHLAGDLHQPLHSIGRFTHEIPNGDRGGNEEQVTKATGEVTRLHFYWDGMFGGYSTTIGAITDARDSKLDQVPVDQAAAAVVDPAVWLNESFELAKSDAYAAPVGPGKGPYVLTRDYETNARNLARKRAALAAARLANLIKAALN